MAAQFGLNSNGFMDFKQNEKSEMVGKVVANDAKTDPKKLGGVRIQVSGYNEKIPIDHLPICYPKRSIGTGTGKGIGSFVVPAIGTQVIVERIDTYNWVYVSEFLTSKHTDVGKFQGDYPDTWGMKDRTGNMSQLNMKTGKAYFLHSSGSSLTALKSGTIQGLVKDDLEVQVNDKGVWKYNGTLSLTVNESETVKIGKSRTTTIGNHDTLTVNGQLKITCTGGVLSIQSTGILNLISGSTMNLIASNVINIIAPTVNIT